MATNAASVTPDTLITIKISLNDAVKKLKLPLKDLNSTVLPDKLRSCLSIPAENTVILERYSDSAGGYITLTPNNVPVYKALVRAAKAKGKLRLKASIIPPAVEQEQKSTQTIMQDSKPVADNPTLQEKRSSAALDRRSVGSGIFQFREARASQQTLVEDEAPVPKAFTAPQISEEKRQATLQACQELAFRTLKPNTCIAMNNAAWSVYCNICDVAMSNAHYHCGICDGGDYDLCETCVGEGKTCPGEDHWLIKRFIADGKVVTSTTERITRKPAVEIESKMPGAFTEETKVLAQEPRLPEPTRTCNSCVVVLPESEFVTCCVCEDYDLCIPCHNQNKHGHHPAHEFDVATSDTILSPQSELLLRAGRNIEHNAFCDSCDNRIQGVRHKCLQCPDWDYCDDCIHLADTKHPGHRFAALYERLADPQANTSRHFGIYCDGPLCNGRNHQSYIQGVRYKCAVCHDTDFCANCEALPGNHHNRTHPLIKFTTPVRNVNITTINEDVRGNIRNMGDKRPEPIIKTENAAIPVQTVADIAPSEEKSLQAVQPIDGDVASISRSAVTPVSLLNAVFVRDTIADGTVVAPGERFTQIWTLRNEGPHAWPVGCSVRYVGGDNMLNVDNGHPASVAVINEAIESSVVAREVLAGEEIAFRITLKAPMRQGKSISYWRLKTVDGTPFGHRLWCDIDVRYNKLPTPPQRTSEQVNRLSQEPSQEDALRQQEVYRLQQSRLQALHQTQLRLFQQQQMHRLAQTPTPIKTNFTPALPLRQAGDRLGPIMPSRPTNEEENARKESAKARMDAIRARILSSRAEQLHSYATMKEQPPTVDASNFQNLRKPGLAAPTPVQQVEVVKQAEPVEQADVIEEADVVKDDAEAETANESASSSQMVFPKLEKESPASSMISSTKAKAAYVENEEGQIEDSAVPASPAIEQLAVENAEDFDDLEVLSVSAVSDEEDEDDGFLTDEEYDILDASDRETVASP